MLSMVLEGIMHPKCLHASDIQTFIGTRLQIHEIFFGTWKFALFDSNYSNTCYQSVSCLKMRRL